MSEQNQRLSFKQAADRALKNGYLFTRPCYNGKALFFRPAHTTTTGDIQKYTSVPNLVKEILEDLHTDTPVEYTHYLCALDLSVNGNKIAVAQNVQVSENDKSACDWVLITSKNACSYIQQNHE